MYLEHVVPPDRVYPSKHNGTTHIPNIFNFEPAGHVGVERHFVVFVGVYVPKLVPVGHEQTDPVQVGSAKQTSPSGLFVVPTGHAEALLVLLVHPCNPLWYVKPVPQLTVLVH
jgi:hypothetical protein